MAKKATKKATETKATKVKVERDKWGAGVTTQLARINAAINATPQTAKQIAEASQANYAATCSHLRTLTVKGFIEHVDGGYVLKTQAKQSTRKSTRKSSSK